jgi:hypothetical protein
MLRGRPISMLLGAALVLSATPALASLRNPQVPVQGTALQQLLNSFNQTINVNTAQVYVYTFAGIGVTQPAANFAARIELGEGALQLLDANDFNLPTVTVLPSLVTPGWYSYVTFPDFGHIRVTLFDAADVVQGQTLSTMPVHTLSFAITDAHGTFYAIDDFNSGDETHILAYPGTGALQASVWLALESDGDGDFADAVFLLEGAWLVPVQRASWGTLKRRFR